MVRVCWNRAVIYLSLITPFVQTFFKSLLATELFFLPCGTHSCSIHYTELLG